MADTTADREIVITRLIDAPRDLVFDAFTEREHVENWWVPSGTIIHEFNGQPGGLWRYSMPGPDGAQYPFRIRFVEVDRPTRLVYEYGTDIEGAPEPVRAGVSFEEERGRTRVTLKLMFVTAAAREEAAQFGAPAGAQQALGNLAKYLSTFSTAQAKE